MKYNERNEDVVLLRNTEKEFKSLQVANSNVVEVKYLDENILINSKNITVDDPKLKIAVYQFYPKKRSTGVFLFESGRLLSGHDFKSGRGNC